jgi:hypothetical protein
LAEPLYLGRRSGGGAGLGIAGLILARRLLGLGNRGALFGPRVCPNKAEVLINHITTTKTSSGRRLTPLHGKEFIVAQFFPRQDQS